MNDTDAKIHDNTVTGNYFEDFRLGQEIVHATPRTVTVGDTSLFTALYGPRFAVQSSDAFAHDDRLSALADRRSARVPYRHRQDRAGHLAQRHRQSRLCRVPLPRAGLSRRHARLDLQGDRGEGELQQEERHGLCALHGQEPARAAGAVLCALGDGQQARRRCAGARARGARACRERRSRDARRGAAAARPRRLRLRARRLAQALGRLRGRREDRPYRRADHRGGRASARHPPVPEHGAGAFQSACGRQGTVRPPPRLWRPYHLDRAVPELQRPRQRLPHSRAERRAPRGAVLRRRHDLCLERGARQSRAAGARRHGRAPPAHLRRQGSRLRRLPRLQGRRQPRGRRRARHGLLGRPARARQLTARSAR